MYEFSHHGWIGFGLGGEIGGDLLLGGFDGNALGLKVLQEVLNLLGGLVENSI